MNEELCSAPKNGPYISNGVWILIIALVVRVFALLANGNEMYLYSDDGTYIHAAVSFWKAGRIVDWSWNDTAVIMPGMPVLLGGILSITGYTENGLLLARIPFVLMGSVTALFIYKLGKELLGEVTGICSGLLLALYIPFVEINLLFMTETPIIFGTVLYIYYFVNYIKKSERHYKVLAILSLLFVIVFKPNILVIVCIGFLCCVIKNKKECRADAVKMVAVSGLMIALVLMPWWGRNYRVFNEFVPFTDNGGDALLLGTYQGHGFPEGTYQEDVQVGDVIAKERGGNFEIQRFKARGEIAKERITEWIRSDLRSFVVSNIYEKPIHSLKAPFYWLECLGIKSSTVIALHISLIAMAGIGLLMLLISKKRRGREMKFIILSAIVMILASAIFYAYSRYQMAQIPLLCLFAGYFIDRAKYGITVVALSMKCTTRKITNKGFVK